MLNVCLVLFRVNVLNLHRSASMFVPSPGCTLWKQTDCGSVFAVGFDVPERVVTAYAPSTRVAFSAKADIGRAIAQLAILAMLPDSAVPDHVRIAGTNVSPLDLQAILSKVYPGEGEFKLVTEDVVKAKVILRKEIQAGNIGMPAGHIRYVYAALPLIIHLRTHSLPYGFPFDLHSVLIFRWPAIISLTST